MDRFKAAAPYVFPLLMAAFFLVTFPISAGALHLGAAAPGAGHPTATIETEDVRNTLHNMGDSIASFDNPNIIPGGGGSTTEVCAFCHTPHGASTSAPGAAPLWNREVPASAGYTLYGSPNFDSTPIQPQGVSLACLSCHDGTIALDALINLPGSGGFRGYAPGSSDFVDPAAATFLIDAGGTMTATLRDTAGGANYEAILLGASPFPNLGIDLSDDHPISMPIPNATAPCTGYAGSPDPQFDGVCGGSTVDGNLLLLARSVADAPADKRDSLRAYPPPATSDITVTTFIECASCHNPHAPRPLFLRLPSALGVTSLTNSSIIPISWGGDGATDLWANNPNSGSAICLSCHQK